MSPARKANGVEYHKWWEDRTNIPWSWWEDQGMVETVSGVGFTSSVTSAIKYRGLDQGRQKAIWWSDEGKRFPLWPDVPDSVPEIIYITEGESDVGPFRYSGFAAWAITGGSAAVKNLDIELFVLLKERGAEVVFLAFDDDFGGSRGVDILIPRIRSAGLRCFGLPLSRIRDPFTAEKDILDIWKRLDDRDEFIEQIQQVSYQAIQNEHEGVRVSFDELMEKPFTEPQWLIRDIWLANSFGFFVGPPKSWKSILTLQMAISVATGQPFLGEFEPDQTGSVIIISKEDAAYALKDRMSKMMEGMGLGNMLSQEDSALRVAFGKSMPIFFDLSREFIFCEEHIRSLILWVRDIERNHPPVRLIVIDPLLRAIDGDTDLFSASQVNSSIISQLARLRKDTSAAVVVVHHSKKDSGHDSATSMNSWYGSIMLFLSTESYISALSRPDDEGYVNVVSGTKNSAELDWAYRVNFTDDDITIDYDPPDSITVTTV